MTSKQRNTTLLILFLFSCPLTAQNTFFGYGAGYGFYSMKGLDHLQELRLEASWLPVKTTESYPASLNYHFEMGKYMHSFISKLAFGYGYGSTGARSTVSDYSGRYDLDAIINHHRLGLTLEHVFATSGSWEYGTYIETGFIYSRLKTKDFFNLTYPVRICYEVDYDFVAYGGYGEFGLILNYKYRFLIARLNMGYFFDIQRGFHLKGDKYMLLYLEDSPLRPQWDGLRIGLQLSILLRTPKSNG
jgi:hypothetical protein